MVTLVQDLVNELKATKAETVLEKEAGLHYIREMDPDAVVIATGARPFFPDIPGSDYDHVVHAWDLLSGERSTGGEVVVIGGNAVGLESALYLARQGTLSPEALHFLMVNRAETADTLRALLDRGNKRVTVVEMRHKAGMDLGLSTRWTILSELKRLGATVMTGYRAVGIDTKAVEVEGKDGRRSLGADSVVIATGAVARDELARELEGTIPEIYTVGDAKEPRTALDAVREGHLVGTKL
jgi:2,4-dienoyl-CoA reductase (NADPH2)